MDTKTPLTYCSTLVLLASVAVSGCDTITGGPCTYDDTPGTATIASVEDADPADNNCANDPVEVVFDFAPDDPGAADLAATGLRLTIAGGANPPLAWVEDEGLTEGSAHDVIRRDITRGTCTPVLYEFLNVDYDAGIAACY